MERIDFKDLPDTTTPITADNLNLLQDNIENIFTDVKDWTPSLVNASATYTIQTGKYIKIGKLVFVWFRLRGTINSVTSPGYAYIDGLPYTCVYETSGNILEHLNISDDNTRNILLKVTNKRLAVQQDNINAGAYIENWYANEDTFYLGGSAVYITNE